MEKDGRGRRGDTCPVYGHLSPARARDDYDDGDGDDDDDGHGDDDVDADDVYEVYEDDDGDGNARCRYPFSQVLCWPGMRRRNRVLLDGRAWSAATTPRYSAASRAVCRSARHGPTAASSPCAL